MTTIESNGGKADNSTGAGTQQLNVTGYGSADAPTLELSPTTKRAEIDTHATAGGVSLVVDVYAPGGVRTRTPAELFPEQARQLADALNETADDLDRRTGRDQ